MTEDIKKIYENEEMEDQPFQEPISYKYILETPTSLSEINETEGKKLNTAINDNGQVITDLINEKLNTATKQILSDFTFGASGAIRINKDANNGLWISPNGILGKKGGVTTFTIDNSGNAIFSGTVIGALIQTGSTTGSNKTIRLSSQTSYLIEFLYGSDTVGTIECLYNENNDMFGIGLYGGGGAYLEISGKSNMGFSFLGLSNTYFGLAWDSNDSDTERIETNAKISADWIPYTNNIYDLGSSDLKWKDLYLSGNAYTEGDVYGDSLILGASIFLTSSSKNPITDGQIRYWSSGGSYGIRTYLSSYLFQFDLSFV